MLLNECLWYYFSVIYVIWVYNTFYILVFNSACGKAACDELDSLFGFTFITCVFNVVVTVINLAKKDFSILVGYIYIYI